jgi:hypothetical protein
MNLITPKSLLSGLFLIRFLLIAHCLNESSQSGSLKRDVPSGCHYHPNSVQHMVMIEGQGQSSVGNLRREMIRFGTPDQPLETVWYVINEGVPHEFFPEETEMIVVSFHTCEARELEEIACGSGGARLYLG